MNKKLGFAPMVLVFIVAVMLAVGVGGFWYYLHRFPLVAGKEFTFQGTVLENITIENQHDGPAYFFLLTDKGIKIKVVYTPGMSCYNYEAITIGFSTKTGDRVEVRGKAISKNELFTCESKDYYIKFLDSGTGNTATSTTANWQTYPSTGSTRLAQAPAERASSPQASSGQAATDISSWKTYRNEQYGFEVQYPPRFSNVGENSSYSPLNDAKDKAKAIYIGPLTFGIADTAVLKQRAEMYFKGYEENKKVPLASCSVSTPASPNPSLRIRTALCNAEDGTYFFSLVESSKFYLFIDGYLKVYNSTMPNFTFRTQHKRGDFEDAKEIDTLLSTIKLIR